MGNYKVYTLNNPKNHLTEQIEWRLLAKHHADIASIHMRHLFSQDPERFSRFSLQAGGLFLDYSRNRILSDTIKLLCNLAEVQKIKQKRTAYFAGSPINITENRPALHTALRDSNHTPRWVNGNDIALLVRDAKQKMFGFVQRIHSQEWRGATGKPITDIVNIGIGGSCLGPLMGVHALADFAVTPIQFHFVSTVDKAQLDEVLKKVEPESTLFILSSKSFSTLETMTNGESVLAWLRAKLGGDFLNRHVVAVTSAYQKAKALGLNDDNIFPLWEWVGGRYSIWSAIGLPLLLMIGCWQFEEFLKGAHQMDLHFQQAELSENMPVLLGLLGVWYGNFFGASAHAIIPYAHQLRYFIPYLQQADMESNGKSVNLEGECISYSTSPIIFGLEGCDGQHTYHQLLHQGQHLVPVDFILVGQPAPANSHYDILMASALSQAQALMQGKTVEEAYQELLGRQKAPAIARQLANHMAIPGNKPSNILFVERLTPENLGALLALYEHKIFVQGAIWNINSFDQWGVELGKQMLPPILERLQGKPQAAPLDAATEALINRFKRQQQRESE